MWNYLNGLAIAHPTKKIVLFGSDGSQQEGNNAEAARFAVAHNLNIKLIVDDNNMTITGHPSDYMPGYNIKNTLEGYGIKSYECEAEDINALYENIRTILAVGGPVALINKRKMAPGIPLIEGTHEGHDVVAKDVAVSYLEKSPEAIEILKSAERVEHIQEYKGSSKEFATNRKEFGKAIVNIMSENIHVFDCDLAGSTGLNFIEEASPNQFIQGGIMERHNFSAAAGVSYFGKKQGIVSTFSAFLEMIISELTMARLNQANVIAHFSHAGVDWMADNTCHFGINNFFADGGLESDNTRLYFPADALQMHSTVKEIFDDKGIRFIFSTRSSTPYILDENGDKFFEDYTFKPGKDDIIRKGAAGYIISYGDMLYRSLDAVERLKEEGIDIGLINKTTLNVVDEEIMTLVGNSPFILVVESQNRKTGLGSRFGSYLLERGLSPKYDYMGVTLQGEGGVYEQIPFQKLDPDNIIKKVKNILKEL